MRPPERRSKAPWIILGGVLGALFLAGTLLLVAAAAGVYVYFYGNPLAPAIPHTPYSTHARLPPDMREVAQRASTDFAAGDYDKAAADYRQIIDKYPDSLYAWSNLGVVRFQQNDYQGARVALEQCVAMAPNDAFSQANLGITYYELGQYDEALTALEKATALDPLDAKTHNYLGCCLSQKGRQLDAEREYKRAIELNTRFGDAYFNLALVLATAKPPDLPEAKANYQRALSLGVARNPRLEKMLAGPPSGT